VTFYLGELNMKKLIFLTSLLLLSACGTQGTINGDLLSKPVPSKQSRLIIERNTSLKYLAGAADVSLNGLNVASLGRGASVVRDVPAGRHTLSVHAPMTVGNYTASFDTKVGKAYVFEVGPNENKSMVPGALFGYLGEAMDAQINENSGYFQIKLKEVKE